MNDQNDGSVTFALLPGWRKRAKEIKRRYKVSLVRMCRDGLKAQIEHFEQLAEEEERKKAERREKRNGGREVRRSARLAPERVDLSPDALADTVDLLDPIDALYDEHAAKILAVLDNKLERRTKVREAISAIQARSPLTCPDEPTILSKLEERVVALRDAQQRSPLRSTSLDGDRESDAAYFDALLQRLGRLKPTTTTSTEKSDEMEGAEIDPKKIRTTISSSLGDESDHEQET